MSDDLSDEDKKTLQQMMKERRKEIEKEDQEPRQMMEFGLTDEQILLVGKAVLNWGRVEWLVGIILITSLGDAAPEYQIALQAMDHVKKIEMLKNLLNKKKINEACRDPVEALVYSNQYRSGRNIFSHGGALATPSGTVILTGKGQALHVDDLPLVLAQSQYALAAALLLPNAIHGHRPQKPLPQKPRKLPARSGLGDLLEDTPTM